MIVNSTQPGGEIGAEGLLIIHQPTTAFLDFTGLLKVLSDNIQNSVYELPAFRRAVLFSKFYVFVDGDLDRDIGKINAMFANVAQPFRLYR